MPRGHTLPELCTALLLGALALSVVLPGASAARDRLSVAAAREGVAGLIAEARVAALAHGGATVHLETLPARAWSEAGDTVLRALDLTEWGVSLALSGGRTSRVLRYDALGLGQVASETVRFRRGRVDRALVVSGFGRVRRP